MEAERERCFENEGLLCWMVLVVQKSSFGFGTTQINGCHCKSIFSVVVGTEDDWGQK